jgi:phosphatidylserine/phosphatidylglycerophosphate/cardiolipin synthase-like enzyme
MRDDEKQALRTLTALVAGREDLVSRIAAPLWARVGKRLDSDLLWARPLLGNSAPDLLIQALDGFNALDRDTGILKAEGLSRLLTSLIGDSGPVASAANDRAELVWTLPNSHPASTSRGQTYLDRIISLINETSRTLTLVSPFIDPQGIGTLLSPLVAALSRGVKIRLFVHDALNLGTPTSRTLEELRRDAQCQDGDLSVYSAEAGTGRDRPLHPLFHAKLVVSDDRRLLLGSANLTSPAFASNFEAGVVLGADPAAEALFILDGILRANTVYLVFQTKRKV